MDFVVVDEVVEVMELVVVVEEDDSVVKSLFGVVTSTLGISEAIV